MSDLVGLTLNLERRVMALEAQERPALTGPFRIGDASNYTQWDTTGHQTMVGNARPWRDALGELLGKKKIGSRITDDLTEGTTLFSDSCKIADDWIIMNVQFNHDRDSSANVSPHLHWLQASANVPNWLIEYRWQKLGGAKVTSWTRNKYISHAFTYTSGTIHQVTEFTDITPVSGSTISDIVQFRILRDTNNASGLFAGADPLTGDASALAFDIHIQLNSLGSDTEFTK